MVAVPIVADVAILYGPVAPYADENILAKVVGIDVPNRPIWTPVIAHKEMVSGPYYSMAYTVMPVQVHVRMRIAMGLFHGTWTVMV
jgi:hypothetical protein